MPYTSNIKTNLDILHKEIAISFMEDARSVFYTLIIGHKSCIMLSILNKLTLQKKCRNFVTSKVFLDKKSKNATTTKNCIPIH